MDTNLYALEQLVADRLARARAEAAQRGLASCARRRDERSRRRTPAGALRARLGVALIALGRVLVGDRGDAVGTRAGSRGG